jgi:hypothetical protein
MFCCDRPGRSACGFRIMTFLAAPILAIALSGSSGRIEPDVKRAAWQITILRIRRVRPVRSTLCPPHAPLSGIFRPQHQSRSRSRQVPRFSITADSRAKVYRGAVRGRGSFREMAYDRKQDALINFCDLLEPTAYIWGWGIDDKQQLHKHVLYVDLPTGQVSFHSSERGAGPDYSKPWDGKHGQCPRRVCEWIESILVTPVQIA